MDKIFNSKLPKSWEIISLFDISTPKQWKTISKKKLVDEGFYVYGANGIIGKYTDYTHLLPTLMITCRGATCGNIHISKPKSYINGNAMALDCLSAKIDIKYLYYFLKQADFSKIISGSAQPQITQEGLKGLVLKLAPVNEQHRIVAKIEELFSELDKGIESLKTAREQLKVYRQSLLKHAFEGKLTEQWRKDNADKLESANDLLARIQKERETRYQQQLDDWKAAVKQWEDKGKEGKKPSKPSIFKPMPKISEDEIALLPKITSTWKYFRLAEIAKIGSGMSVSKSRKLEKPVEVAYLRVANVQRGKLVLDEVKKMNIESEKLNDLKLKKYDVLFNEGGDRDKLGRGWIWESQVEPCITQNHVFRTSTYLCSSFHSKFVSHWGNSFGRDYFERVGKQTTNLASINKTVLSMFPVPMPSIKEQEKIIEMIDSSMSTIDAFEKDIEASLFKSQALRQSILKKAFSGQLVPQDPNDESASNLLKRIAEQKQAILAQEKANKKIKAKTKKKHREVTQ